MITCIGMIIFMGITGFSPSAVRAGIMAVIFYSGYIFTKHPDGMNSLWIAVLIMCVFDPLTAQNVGFLLSVASTFGILLLGKPFGKVIKRILQKFRCMESGVL